MINMDAVRRAISEFITMDLPESIDRDIDIDLSVNKITVIAGIRRSGKTYEIFNIMKHLLDIGTPRGNILYINFEDERFIGFGAGDFDYIMDAFELLSDIDKNHDIHIFFDEIQNVADWDRAIRRLYDTNKYKIFLTGSSSKLLSMEISTSLAGRDLTYIMYPFSFKEFLRAKKFNPDKLHVYSDAGKLKKYAMEYILYGGFPEIAYIDDTSTKRRIISSYYDTIIFRDMSGRYNISDINVLKLIIGYAINSYSSEFSSTKLYNYLKSINISISKKTVSNYIQYAENAFFISMNLKFSNSYKKMHQTRKKLYLIDNSFSLLYKKSDDNGKLLENSVYIQLLRIKEIYNNMDIFYYRNACEIDFIVTEDYNLFMAVQACYDLNMNNFDREVKPLKKFLDKYNLKNGIIITMNDNNINIGDERIKILNFYQWMLGDITGK